jgi:hypothetical protein
MSAGVTRVARLGSKSQQLTRLKGNEMYGNNDDQPLRNIWYEASVLRDQIKVNIL